MNDILRENRRYTIDVLRKNQCRSYDIPLEHQYRENWHWEDSFQRYELDNEFQEKSYFQNMDPEDLCRLVRKMDNFLVERGVSYRFIRNYYLAVKTFNELDNSD